jgi:hypothetical protein
MLFTGSLIIITLCFILNYIVKISNKELILTNNSSVDELLCYGLMGISFYCTYNFITYKTINDLYFVQNILILTFTFIESIKAYNERKSYTFALNVALFISMFILLNQLI